MRYLLALLLTSPLLAQTTPTDGPPLSSAKQDYKHFGEFDFRYARMVRTKAVLLAPTNGSTCLNPYERVFAYADGKDHVCNPSSFGATEGTWATVGGSSGGGVEPSLFADLPVACSPGDLKYVTDATPPGVYGCPVTNTWAREKVSVHPDGSIVEDTVSGVTRHRVCPTCFLQTANNLSDLTDPAAARTNLGITAGTTLSTSGSGHLWPFGRPGYPSNNAAIGAGTMHYQEFVPPIGIAVKSIYCRTESGAGTGQYGSMGIYDASGNLAAQTNVISVDGLGFANITWTFGTAYTVTAGNVYFLGYAASGTATFTLRGSFSDSDNILNTGSVKRTFTGSNSVTGTSAMTFPATIGTRTAEEIDPLACVFVP